MTSLRLLLALVWLGSALAWTAGAEPVPFDGTASLQGFADLAPVAMGSGVADVNPLGAGPHLLSLALPGGVAAVTSTVTPTTPPTAFPYTKLIASVADGPGTFTETSGGVLRGAMPLVGNVRLCFLLDCLAFLDIPLTQNGTRGVGLGGPPIVVTLGTIATISLEGAPWSTGTLSAATSAGTATIMGFARGPASMASSTALGGGELQLVTPIRITATAGGGEPTVLDLFGAYHVSLMPEPARGALLGAGALALWLLGRRRRRHP